MAIYIKLGDEIKGEATDDKHADYCDANSFGFGVIQPVSAIGTGGRASGRSTPTDCTIQMVSDKAYPDIYHHCATGKHIVGNVELHQVQDSGAEKIVYEKIIFTECMFSSCQLDASGSEKPYLSISFVYDTIEITHTPAKDDGSADTPVTKAFDYKANA